jgi:hypothetical protein
MEIKIEKHFITLSVTFLIIKKLRLLSTRVFMGTGVVARTAVVSLCSLYSTKHSS